MIIGASERVMSEQDRGVSAEIPGATGHSAEAERGTFQLKSSPRQRKSAGNMATRRFTPWLMLVTRPAARLQITCTRNDV
jgi:hypothetical protein